ncbi:MAG: GNAT family N-acetyltransferase [Acidobacteriota bacterium]
MSTGRYQTIVVRRATSADAAEIALVEASALDALRRTYRPKDTAVSAAIARDTTCLVACFAGHVVGALHYVREQDRLQISGLEVHDRHRRRGVARALLAHLDEVAESEGCATLALWTVKESGNVAILERLGFRAVSEEPSKLLESDPASPVTEVAMERRVGP